MKAVVLHSGGLDSTVLLWHLMKSGHEVFPLSINYGQRHWKELNAAFEVCKAGDLPWQKVELSPLHEVLKGSSQTDATVEVPEGHYGEDNMKVTVVPNRNMILLSIATAYAISLKAGVVAYAAHAGDHAQYPDCRAPFINAISNAIQLCDYDPPILDAPFANRAKADLVIEGDRLGAPLHLTWSCYKGGENHCGKCGTCTERAEAFHLARVPDPTVYEDSTYWRTVCGVKR